MPAPKPLVTDRPFGRLTVLRELESDPKKGRMVLCSCECGAELVVIYKSLRTGNTQSCGCLRREMVTGKNITHGLSKRPEYIHWKAMRSRCNNPNAEKYPEYGGKGVKVCKRWDDFSLFLEDVGTLPSQRHSLDRFPDRNGDYQPGNVRWATPSEQTRNRDCMDTVTFNGSEMLVVELAEAFGLTAARLRWKLKKGWSVEEAVNTPVVVGRNQYERD